MPGFNGQGPQSMGPMTGGGRGYCVGTPGMARGYGAGYGRGGGRGRRNRFCAAGLPGWQYAAKDVPESDLTVVCAQEAFLQQQLERVKQRKEQLTANDKLKA